MEEQETGQQEQEQEQEQVQGEHTHCPVCGCPMWPRRGQWGMRHMGPWGYRGPRGRWYAGPWGGTHHHTGHWLHQPVSMVWAGVVPALLGFAVGYMMASARMSALYAIVSEEKRRR